MDDLTYTLLLIDGELGAVNDPYTSVLRFEGLTKTEALDLAERSMMQGYCVASWIEPEGDAECGEA